VENCDLIPRIFNRIDIGNYLDDLSTALLWRPTRNNPWLHTSTPIPLCTTRTRPSIISIDPVKLPLTRAFIDAKIAGMRLALRRATRYPLKTIINTQIKALSFGD